MLFKVFYDVVCRYSKGFGVIGDLLGDNHPLNLYNSLYGILFYVGNTFLGML